MELLKTKKINDPVFCNVCEKERKHMLATYECVNDNNETYTVEMQKCKSCGNETEVI
ncbi:MAG: hypothetical protein ACRDA3_06315 [Peptostreptococcaceae bacterium]